MDHKRGVRQRLIGVAGALTAVAVGVPLVFGSSALPVEVAFLDSIAWLANDANGDVVRVNGQTGQVDARLEIGDSEEVAVVQDDGVVLVQVGDEIRSIDPARLDWGEAVSAEGELVVGDGPGGEPVVYLVAPTGVVQQMDPTTLEVLHEVDLGGVPGHGLVAGGRLVVPVSGDDGAAVEVVDGTEVVGSVAAGGPDDRLRVSRVGDQVAVVNLSQGAVRPLDPGGDDPRAGEPHEVDLPAGEIRVPRELPGGRLWLAAERPGELLGVDLDSGRTDRVEVAAPRSDLHGPVMLDGTVYLVDRTAAALVEVDAASLTVETHDLDVDDAAGVEILAKGGKVFVNDRASEMALVVSGPGEHESVDKYSDEGMVTEVPPDDRATDGGPEEEPEQPDAGDDSPAPSDTAPPGTAPPGTTAPPPPSTTTSSTTTSSTTTTSTTVPPTTSTTAPPPPGPAPVDVVEAEPGDGEVTVTWRYSDADIDGSWPDQFQVRPRGGEATTVPGSVAAGQLTQSTTMDGLTNGTAYTFEVRGTNAQGETAWVASNEVTPGGPPGPVSLTSPPVQDGGATLTWSEAASALPVTYTVTAEPAIGGETSWETPELSRSFSGMTNGVTYTFTVTPRNDRGDGTTATATVTPAGEPTVSNASATPTGDRTFEVTFDYSANGAPAVSGCQVRVGSGSWQGADCAGGSGSASVSVPDHSTSYTFTVRVATAQAEATGTASGTSADKTLTVDGPYGRWGGSCHWDDYGSSRPVLATPEDVCDSAGDDVVGTRADGSSVEVSCWTTDSQLRDDDLVYSDHWFQVDGGWMNELYFGTGSYTAGVPQC